MLITRRKRSVSLERLCGDATPRGIESRKLPMRGSNSSDASVSAFSSTVVKSASIVQVALFLPSIGFSSCCDKREAAVTGTWFNPDIDATSYVVGLYYQSNPCGLYFLTHYATKQREA